ncbi:MAG: TlpA family protein disulfide reductase [Anaerolineae bacterium]
MLSSMKNAPRTAALLLVVVLAAVGCAPAGAAPASAASAAPAEGANATQVASPSPAPTKLAAPQRPRVGMPAYPFTLVDLKGNSVSLSDLRGKVVMVNFWASWCSPCQQEIPHMVRVYDELKDDGLVILAVNLQEDEASVHSFVEQQGMRFPVLLDPSGSVAGSYFVRAIPTSLFLDENGVIQVVYEGTLTEDALRQGIEEARE